MVRIIVLTIAVLGGPPGRGRVSPGRLQRNGAALSRKSNLRCCVFCGTSKVSPPATWVHSVTKFGPAWPDGRAVPFDNEVG